MRQREEYGRLSETDRLEIGDRIRSGETHAEIAAAVGCSTKSIQRLLRRAGGLAPRGRNRSPSHLTVAEREEISRGLRAGDSFRAIAGRLGRAPSTISREVAANGSRQRYRAWRAERRAAQKARRPKVAKLARCPRLRRKVKRLLAERWSPQQIAHRLRLDHPSDPGMRVPHETIYQSLYVQTRGALRKELAAYLRTGRTRRRSPRHRPGEGRLKDMVSISERPAEAADRAVPGHWEGDLILGQLGRSAIGVLVERRSRYVLLLHLPDGRTASHVRRALVEQMITLPEQLKHSLTWDQGKEMAEHVRFSIEERRVRLLLRSAQPPGNAGPARTPTACSANTSAREPISPPTPKRTSMPSPDSSTAALRQTLGWMKPCEVFAKTVAFNA